MNARIRHARRLRRLLTGVATLRWSLVTVVLLFSAEFLELLAKRRDASFQRPHARVTVGVDLAEPFKLRLSRDHLACNCSRRIQNRLAFLLDVEGVVLAGKLRKLVDGFIEISLRNFQAFFEEHAFTVC